MTWKKLNNGHLGKRKTFGGADIDKISSLFDGTGDVDNVDINSSTTVRDGKLKFRNPANTFSYNIQASAITADRNITMPVMTNNPEFVFENASQLLQKKTVSNCEFMITDDTHPASYHLAAVDPTLMRWGTIFPMGDGSGGTIAQEGMLSNHTLRVPSGGTMYFEWNTFNYDGMYVVIETPDDATGEHSGIISPTTGPGLFRMSHDATIRMRWATARTSGSDAIIYFGLSTSPNAPFNTTNPLGNNDSGVIIGVHAYSGVAHRGVYAYHHNGNGTTPSKTYMAGMYEIEMGNMVMNDVEIRWTNDYLGLHVFPSIKSSSPGASLNQVSLPSSKVPAATTDLYFHAHLITGGPHDKLFGIAGVWAESL